MEENILNNMDMTQGVTPEGTPVDNKPMSDLTDIIKTRFENGEPALDILVDLIMQGVNPDQMGMSFEEIGFDPGSYTQLLQDAEIKIQGMQQQQAEMQQQQMPEQSAQPLPPVSEEELLAESERAAREIGSQEQPQSMQYGSETTSYVTGRPTPLYTPPIPRRGNIFGAGLMLADAADQFFSNEDRNGDGVMDGTFKDWSAKNARYKDKQFKNRSYKIKYGDSDPDDFVITKQGLLNEKLETKDEFANNLGKYSLLDFDPETGSYFGTLATSPEAYDMLGIKDKEKLGLIGAKKEFNIKDPKSWFGREDAPLDKASSLERFVENLSNQDDIDLQMMKKAMKYGPGKGLNPNRSSYDESTLKSGQIKDARNNYRDIMMGKQSMGNQPMSFDYPINNPDYPTNNPMVPKEQPLSFKDWALQDPVTRMGANAQLEYNNYLDNFGSSFRYGGDLVKAQFGLNDYDPNNPYGIPDFSQMGQTSYINPATGMPYDMDAPLAVNQDNPIRLDEVTVTAPAGDGLPSKGLSQIPIEMPQMNFAPIDFSRFQSPGVDLQSKALTDFSTETPDMNLAQVLPTQSKIEGLASKELTEIPVEMPEMKMAPIDLTPPTPKESNSQPEVKRKRSVSNAINQVETFIKDNPYMRAYGDVSDFAVKGANLANEFFTEKEFMDYKNKLRNSTSADRVYRATEDPVNKRGTFDVNLGLAEPDNLVDYYAQAMYGREMYKKGGEFEPHIMYDPKTGKGYEAKVPADHERMAKMGYLHKDEMQLGGEKDYVDKVKTAYSNDNLLGYLEYKIDDSLGSMNYDLPYTPEQKAIIDDVDRAHEDLYRYEDRLMRDWNYDKSRFTDEENAELKRLKEVWETKKNSDAYKSIQSAMEFRDVNSDPLRHGYSSAITAQTIADKAAAYIPFSDYLPHDEIIGAIGANILGAGHEASAFGKDERPFMTKAKESGMDMYNNFLGSLIGATTNSPEEAAALVEDAVRQGYTSAGKIERKYGGELEVDNDTLAALIAAGADIEML